MVTPGTVVQHGRPLRANPGGYVYHVLNRANGRLAIFQNEGDYAAFERILAEALEHVPGMRLLAYCVMPNHWHLLLWPRADGELSDFCHWLALTHTQRWRVHYHNVGQGHLYQGRFKSFVVEADDHYLTVCRYVERNAVRAGLVDRAEAWRWGSSWRRLQLKAGDAPFLQNGPVALPGNWLDIANQPQTEAELAALRRSVQRGRPYGRQYWVETVAIQMGLESTLRPVGRPRITSATKEEASE